MNKNIQSSYVCKVALLYKWSATFDSGFKKFFGVTLVASVLIQQNIFVKAKLAFAGEEKQDRYTICLSGEIML